MRVMAVFVFTIVFFDVAIQWEECLFGNDYAYRTLAACQRKNYRRVKTCTNCSLKKNELGDWALCGIFIFPWAHSRKSLKSL